jgi:hypothetical protein
MDRFSPVAAAHIRVLVLPVGQIERQTFLDFVRRLQDEAAIIQHKDLKPIVGQGDFLLSPAKFERGCLLLHYSTSGVGEATLHLSPYEIFREPLLVIGVGKGLGDDGEEEDRKELKAATDYMRERHPRVVHRYLLSLREDEDNTGKLMANVTTVGKSHQAGDPSLVKAMRTVAVRFLRELSTYVQALQASPSIPTPGQTSRSQQRASWMRDVENRSNAGPRNVTSPPPPGEDGPSRPPSRSLASPATSSTKCRIVMPPSMRCQDPIAIEQRTAEGLVKTESQSKALEQTHRRKKRKSEEKLEWVSLWDPST